MTSHKPLVEEMADAGKHHGDVVAVRDFDSLRILHGSTRLDDGTNPRCRGGLRTVWEWKEGVRRHHRSARTFSSLFDSEFDRSYAVHLARTNSHDLPVFRKDDRITLDVSYNTPCEKQFINLFGGWMTLGNHGQI